MMLVPVIYYRLCITDFDIFPQFLKQILPPIVWPKNRSIRAGFPLKTGTLTALIMSDIALLLSFGVFCPPLAIVICLTVIIKIYTKEVLIGRYIAHSIEESKRSQQVVPIKVSRSVNIRIGRAIYWPLTASYEPNQLKSNYSVSGSSKMVSTHLDKGINANSGQSLALLQSVSSKSTWRRDYASAIVHSPKVIITSETQETSSTKSVPGEFVKTETGSEKSNASDSSSAFGLSNRSDHVQEEDNESIKYRILESSMNLMSLGSSELSESVSNAQENIINLRFLPLESLEMASRGMWRAPCQCIGIIYGIIAPLYILVSLDISEIEEKTWTGYVIYVCFAVSFVIVPLILYFAIRYPRMVRIKPAQRTFTITSMDIELIKLARVITRLSKVFIAPAVTNIESTTEDNPDYDANDDGNEVDQQQKKNSVRLGVKSVRLRPPTVINLNDEFELGIRKSTEENDDL